MKAQTDLAGVKVMAKMLLMTEIHESEFSPAIVQHPFTSTGLVLLSEHGGIHFADITKSREHLELWQNNMQKEIDAKQSALEVYMLLNKPYRLTFLKFEQPYLSQKDFSIILSDGKTLMEIVPGREGNRIYSPRGVSITLTSEAGGFGGKTGLYDVNLPIKVKTKAGYQLCYPGDSIDLAYPTLNSRRGRVGEQIAHTVTTNSTQGYFFIDMNENAKLTTQARCITARQDAGISKHKGEHSGVFVEDEPRAILTPDKETVRQQGRRYKEPNEPMFALTVCDRHGIIRYGKVRRLMPIECWRLQGFTDEQFYKAQATGLKDGQLYKMAGNAVSVPVISAIGRKIKAIDEEYNSTGGKK